MVMEKLRITSQAIAAFAACIASLSGGFHFGWTSPSLAKLQADDSDFSVTSSQGAWIASIFNLTTGVGALIACGVVNKWGRRLSLLLAAIPYLVACILIGVAQNHWWLFVARCIAGAGFGIAATILPIYLGEIASDQIRGALGVMLNQMVSIGILMAYSVGPWVSRVALAGVGLALPIIFVLCFFWMPETPYFFVMKNQLENAEKSLKWLRGTNDVKEELKKVEKNIRMEQTGTFKELIMKNGNRKALVLTTILMVGPQCSGILAILAYIGLIFEASGSELSSSISVIIIGVVQFLSGLLSIFIVDIVGRRPLLMLSLGGSIVFLVAEALYFQFQAIGIDVSSISWLPVTAIVGYIFFYAIGLGCLPYVIPPEIFPCNVTGMAMTYGILIISVNSMVITKLYQVVADAYGIHICFYGFATCSVFMALLIYFILPETKQRSFVDIQNELQNSTFFGMAISQNH